MERFPDFLIVGAQKCGTYSLHRWLQAHPDCLLPAIKEPNYFSRFEPWEKLIRSNTIIRDRQEYLNLFAGARTDQICGESSVSYLFEDGVAERIKKTIPECRIIILIRDPVERAYSEYSMNVVGGYENRSFTDAIEDAVFGRPRNSWSDFPLYCEISKYGTQVARYFRNFPKSQIFITTSYLLGNNSFDTMVNISKFLNIDETFWRDYKFSRYNQGRVPRNILAKKLLNSTTATAIGRLFVPKRWRRFISRFVLSGSRKEKEYSQKAVELIWLVCKQEIKMLEEITGTHFSDVWSTYPHNQTGDQGDS